MSVALSSPPPFGPPPTVRPGVTRSANISPIAPLTMVPGGTSRMRSRPLPTVADSGRWPWVPELLEHMTEMKNEQGMLSLGSFQHHVASPTAITPTGPPLGTYFSRRKLTQPWAPVTRYHHCSDFTRRTSGQ